jgi:hypothetical protein
VPHLPDPLWTPAWWAPVADLAAALRGNDDSLTFVLGAGTSLSSGAPSTAEVEAALVSAATRIPPGELRKWLHEIADHDKRIALEPIFAQLRPYVGYRCLAALARSRRVVVINLNWDPLVTMACDLLSVPWVAYDIGDRAQWDASATLPAGRGVVDVHLHGRAADKPRFGFAETLGFRTEELEHLRSLHQGARRVYLGVSLEDDHDVVELLRGLDDGHSATVWAFFRDPQKQDTAETARRLAKLGARAPVLCQSEDVDFDHVLLALVDGVAGGRWDVIRRTNSHVRLPALSQLVLPEPGILGSALDASVTVFVGDPQLGKTTAAWLLCGLHHVWAESPGAVRHFDGATQAKASISVARGANPHDLFVIENPYGEAPDSSPNPGFVNDLSAWAAATAVPRAVITLRTADWETATGGDQPAGVYVASPAPDGWYAVGDLRRFATRSSPVGIDLAGEVAPEALDTPGRILDRAAGLGVATVGAGPDRIAAVERERRLLLEGNPALAALCCVVRLQAFAAEPVDVDTLRVVSHYGGRSPGAALMLYWYELDHRPRVRLALPVDSAAADQWMTDRPGEVAALLDDAACPDSLRDAWGAWALLSAARRGDWATVESAGPAVIAQHAGQLLAANPTTSSIKAASEAALDPWTAADTAYSLVHLWEDLPPERRALLDRLVADSDLCGAYAVLEACLYLQRGAAAEIWDTARSGLWRIGGEGGIWEMALAIDGFAWRPAPDNDWSKGWTREQVDRHPELFGVLPVLAAYHPDGAVGLGLADQIAAGRFRAMTPEQAALTKGLVAWHFVHQSRARAQLGHQRIVEKDYLCRTLHPAMGSKDDEGVMWLLSVLRNDSEPGWAFHAASFLMGALNRRLGRLCRSAALGALTAAPDGDLGVVTAAATYEVAADAELGEAAREHFKGERSRSLLLDALGRGLVMDGLLVGPPGFVFAGRPGRLLRDLGINFTLVEEFFGERPDPAYLAPRIRAATRKNVRAGRLPSADGARLVNLVEHGDLRTLEDALAASGAGTIDLDWLVTEAALLAAMFPAP